MHQNFGEDELEPVLEEIDHPEIMPLTRKMAIMLYDEFLQGRLASSEVIGILIFELVLLRTAMSKDMIHDRVHQAVELADVAMQRGLVINPRTQKNILLSTAEQGASSPDIVDTLASLDIPDTVPDDIMDQGDEDGSADLP